MDEANAFDDLIPDKAAAPDATTGSANTFDDIIPDDPLIQAQGPSRTGATVRGAERGLLPGLGGWAAAGAGAEVGGWAGSVFGPVGTAVGGLGGAVYGGYKGIQAVSSAQDYAMSLLPGGWAKALGQDEKTQQEDIKAHPYYAQAGEMFPMVLTGKPGGFVRKAVPENATALQTIMAHPVTGPALGGSVMLGMELGHEVISKEDLDWRKMAVATGAGIVFNKQNRFGAAITELGARPMRAVGIHPPTVAAAGDLKVMGPGITEDVFHGEAKQDPAAEGAAQQQARDEQYATGHPEAPSPDLHAMARRAEPELFTKYDALSQQRDELRNWITEFHNPTDEALQEHAATAASLQAKLDAHIESQKGYTGGPEARQLKAQIREAQAQHDELLNRRDRFETGQATETPELATVRKHLQETDYAMRDLSPQVSAAYRRAAEGAGQHEEPVTITPLETQAAATTETPRISVPGRPIEDQRTVIATDVEQKLIKAGRPADEAQAAGQVWAERYVARAARFKGALGTAEELYKAEGADIVGATPGARKTKPAAAQKQEPIYIGGKLVTGDAAAAIRAKLSGERELAQGVREPSGAVGQAASQILEHIKAHGGDAGEYGIRIDPDSNYQKTSTGSILANSRVWEDGEPTSDSVGGAAAVRIRENSINGIMKAINAAGLNGDGKGYFGKNVLLVHSQDVSPGMDTEEGIFSNASVVGKWLKSDEGVSPIQPHESKELAQGSQGKIHLAEGQRTVITLFTGKANASTTIHESGHAWLEELMSDAEHPAAPNDVRDDATTVRDWLGSDGGEKITDRQHEKFANGFEQYLREGIAPSPRLAGVFAKFKQWLTQIYRTLKGLGKPINDDIRGVFDRMLAEEPQRTVYAAERESVPTLADEHEADVRLTPPREAGAVADRIKTDKEHAVEETKPVIKADLETESASRPQQPAMGGAGGEPEPIAGSGASGKEPGPIDGGGGKAQADSGGLPGGQDTGTGQRAGAAETGRGPAPGTVSKPSESIEPTPVATIEPAEPKYVDKAGNIRLDNIDTPEDFEPAIREAAAANNDFIGDRQGKITDGQVLDAARAAGMKASDLLKRKIGDAFNAVQIKAAEMIFSQSALHTSDLMKIAANGTDEDVIAYAQARSRHHMIQAQFAGLTAEAGRALRALRKTQELWSPELVRADQFLRDATGRTLYQLRLEAKLGARLETTQDVSKFLRDGNRQSAGWMTFELWVNNIISGFATHATYTAGSIALAIEKVGPETAMAAAIGRVRAAMGREGETVRIGEIAAQIVAAGRGVAPALKGVIEALQTGQQVRLPGEVPRKGMFQSSHFLVSGPLLDEAAKFSDVMTAAFGAVRGIRDGIKASGALLKAGGIAGEPLWGTRYSLRGSIPDITFRGVDVLPVGEAIRLPGRMVAAHHSFMRAINYSMEKAAIAYRKAANDPAGLTGAAFDSKVADVLKNPSADVMQAARNESDSLTLLGQGGSFTKKLLLLTNVEFHGWPLLKFVDPFVHITSNVINESIIKRTPVGLISREVMADLTGENGTIAQDKAQARMLVGTALAITFGGLAAENYVTGSGPSDLKRAAQWRVAGNQPYSIRIDNTWYSTHRLGVLGMILGIGADLYEVAHKADEGEYAEAAQAFHYGIVHNILDESTMRGPSDLINAIEHPQTHGKQYINSFLSSFVPYSSFLGQAAKAIDPYTRHARTLTDAIMAKIPWESQGLFPKIDTWGEPIPNYDALVARGLTAIYESQVTHDPVNQAMLNLGVAPGPVSRSIMNVPLTDGEYDDFARIAGKSAKKMLDRIVTPSFRLQPKFAQHEIIVKVIADAREAARGVMQMKYPHIPHDAVLQQKQRLSGAMIDPISESDDY